MNILTWLTSILLYYHSIHGTHDDSYKRPLEPECRIVQMCETGSVLAAKEQRNVNDFGATKRSSAASLAQCFVITTSGPWIFLSFFFPTGKVQNLK